MLKELEPIAAKLNEACAILLRSLAQVSDEQNVQLPMNPEWSVKDTLAHLIGAKRGMTRMAQQFATGNDPQLPADYNNDVFNARQVAKRKAMPLVDLRAEMDATHKELVAMLDGITSQQLDLKGQHPIYGEISLKDLLVVIYNHETQHCKEIADAIRASKNPS